MPVNRVLLLLCCFLLNMILLTQAVFTHEPWKMLGESVLNYLKVSLSHMYHAAGDGLCQTCSHYWKRAGLV